MKRQTYKRTGNRGLFDLEENAAKLDSLGNPLEKLSKVVDFEMFRETLEAGLYKEKLIKKSVTTSAEQHDSVPTRLLIDNDDRGQELHADSAYIGKNVKSVMRKYQMKDRVIKRIVRGKKLSKKQETINRKNSKTRVRVEHVFGYCELNLHGMFSRVVGLARNAARNILTSLVYNMLRYEQIQRLGMN